MIHVATQYDDKDTYHFWLINTMIRTDILLQGNFVAEFQNGDYIKSGQHCVTLWDALMGVEFTLLCSLVSFSLLYLFY